MLNCKLIFWKDIDEFYASYVTLDNKCNGKDVIN